MMNKLLPLVYLSLLPLPAFALLENASVTATVLPSADDEWLKSGIASPMVVPYGTSGWLLTESEFTAELKAHTEAQLAKVPNLSGMYAGIIQFVVTDDVAIEPVTFFRMAAIKEGVNQFKVVDDKGVFSVDVVLKPEGLHWDYQGIVEYREYVAPERVFSTNTELRLSEGLTITGGLSSENVRRQMAENSLQVADDAATQEERLNMLTSVFFLRTADAPDPKLSPANPINRVTLPSGRVVQLEPGLSEAAAREVLAVEIAKDAAASAANQTSAKD